MKKTLILTEKPSIAIDFVKALTTSNSQFKKNDGYYENNQYIITYAIGHLLQIDNSIAPKKWEWNTLPILPNKFQYIIATKTAKQYKIIETLLQKKTNKVIIATDAGREGELIARLILNHTKWKGPVFRIWTSEALSKNVILRELNNLKPAQDFDNIYKEALSRQHADWLVGINLSRAATLKKRNGNGYQKFDKNNISKQVWSIGRVQTPVLALIVTSHKERENFKPEKYFIIQALFEHNQINFKGVLTEDKKDILKLKNSEAQKILEELKNIKSGIIRKAETKLNSQKPPLLHSLTSLQREANTLYGYTANKTLAIAQKIYETYKAISYPRTDAQHLDETPQTQNLVSSILKNLGYETLTPSVKKVGKRVFDKSKLTDHYAIIPLKQLPENASNEEKNIYNLIKRKFIGAFMDNYKYNTINILIEVKNNYFFKATLRRDINKGWTELYNKKELGIKEQYLDKEPNITVNNNISVKDINTTEKTTPPPPLYTEASLLKKMEKLQLGTPATRASIIETLKKREYIYVKKKTLIPSPKGIELINICQDKEIASPDMTSIWEQKLTEIRKGKIEYNTFINEIKEFVKQQTQFFKNLKN